MKHKDFDRLVEYVVNERIKGVMCAKSAEYSRGDDKLHNFKRAAEVSGKTALECLQGMKLKHDVSILDMHDDEAKGIRHSREKWEEKISDDINYHILDLALLYEKHGWSVPESETIPETVPGYGGDIGERRQAGKDDGCNNCKFNQPGVDMACRGTMEDECMGTHDHLN